MIRFCDQRSIHLINVRNKKLKNYSFKKSFPHANPYKDGMPGPEIATGYSSCWGSKYHSSNHFFKTWKNGAFFWGYLRQICSDLVRVKRRVLSGKSPLRFLSMKIDRTPLRTSIITSRSFYFFYRREKIEIMKIYKNRF